MNKAKRYSPEVRERAVRLLFEHEKDYRLRWAATVSIASKIGCTPETLRGWVRRVIVAPVTAFLSPGPTSASMRAARRRAPARPGGPGADRA